MDNIGPDIEWTCVDLEGTPCLVIQTTGAVTSADWVQREVSHLYLQYQWDIVGGAAQIHVCSKGQEHAPLMICDLDTLMLPLLTAVKQNQPWIFLMQYVVGEQQYARVFLSNASETFEGPPEGVDSEYPLPRWPIQFQEEDEWV